MHMYLRDSCRKLIRTEQKIGRDVGSRVGPASLKLVVVYFVATFSKFVAGYNLATFPEKVVASRAVVAPQQN